MLQQNDPGVLAGVDGFIVPGGDLDLADVGLAQQEHGQAGLADAAADGQGQLVGQEHLVEGQLAAVVAAGDGQLAVQGSGVHADAHGGELNGPVQGLVPEEDVAVQGPVVVVGGAAVVGLAGLQSAADLHEEGGGVVLDPVVLPLLGGGVGPQVLQLLAGDEGYIPLDLRQDAQLGEDGLQGLLGVGHGADDGADGGLQIVHVPVARSDDLFPVPLVHIDGVEVIGDFIPADGVHVGDQALAHGEVVVVQGHALPLGQGVDHLGIPAGGGDVKADGTFHAVQIVVQAGGGLHEQGGGDPAQAQVAA